MAKQQMAKANEKLDVSKPIDQLPEHLRGKMQEGVSRGSENVSNSDIIIPRVEVVQAQSKCLSKKEEGKYIEGSRAGLLYNNVTRQLYGSNVVVCPIIFQKEWLLWVDRKAPGAPAGNGFRGAYKSEAEAIKAKRELGDDGKNLLVTETHQHFVIVVAGGKMEDAVISMSRTKLKVSKNWNSLIRMNGGDRFARLYKIGTAEESNDKGDFHNLTVANFGFAPAAVYARAEKLYEVASRGGLVADRTFDEDGNFVGTGAGDDAHGM